ncbi:MAG TPA: fibronectin/fibrinogen-binding protein [Syntrophomonas sp.]|nr:fibronectin/fibrinogen-binding protein [Syntrophomonas sp.]
MPFDGFTIAAITAELNLALAGARIDKIHQPEKDELVFSIRMLQGGNHRLLLSANPRWARMHLTASRKANPPRPSAFCMLLRKHLEGGKIRAVKQLGFERMVMVDIEALDDFREWTIRRLICEFMGRHSNIILINPETGIIIDAIKKFGSDVSSYREVLPGKPYIAPPGQNKLNPLETEYESFCRGIWAQDETAVSQALFSLFSGVSPFTAREICLMTGINPTLPAAQCGEYELGKLYHQVKVLLETVRSGAAQPTLSYQDGHPVEFAAYPISAAPTRAFDSINTACDQYYTAKLDALRLESWKTNLSRHIKLILDKACKKRFYQEGDLTAARNQEQYKIWGELITAYSYQLEKGMTETVLEDYTSGEKIVIPLDARFSPITNAQRYFKLYNKSRKTIAHLEGLMAANQLEIDYLESVLLSIQQAESTDDMEEISEELERDKNGRNKVKGRKSSGPRTMPRRYLSSDGLDILVGRNNRQNDNLTLKQSDPHDLWLHTKNIPGSHVIVRLPRKIKSIQELPDATLEEAALLAAYFSKARQSEKVEVDYTFRSQVRKPGGAKPGMVIYDNYWTIVINPQENRLAKLLQSEVKTPVT